MKLTADYTVVADYQKPYLSLSGTTWEVLDADGEVANSFSKKKGLTKDEQFKEAQQWWIAHWKELGGRGPIR